MATPAGRLYTCTECGMNFAKRSALLEHTVSSFVSPHRTSSSSFILYYDCDWRRMKLMRFVLCSARISSSTAYARSVVPLSAAWYDS